jgi:threonine/homoserine/homoserine lactone efflux protein
MAATLTLNLTPGPDMLYVIARSISQGRASGIASALGIAGGCAIHTLAVAFGLAQLLAAVPAALDAVKYIGAAYLVYLGARQIRARSAAVEPERLDPDGIVAVFRQGVTTNVLNPKVALFFLAFLPQFTDPARGSVVAQIVLLGVLFNISGTLVNIVVAFAASRAGSWIRGRIDASPLFRWLTGGVFIGLGLRLALPSRRS